MGVWRLCLSSCSAVEMLCDVNKPPTLTGLGFNTGQPDLELPKGHDVVGSGLSWGGTGGTGLKEQWRLDSPHWLWPQLSLPVPGHSSECLLRFQPGSAIARQGSLGGRWVAPPLAGARHPAPPGYLGLSWLGK